MKLVLNFLVAAFCWLVLSSNTEAVVVTNLTQAEMEAALTSGGTITFSTGGTINLATNSLKILTNTIIDGTGVLIGFSGSTNTNQYSRIFYVTNNVTLTLMNLSVLNGTETNGAGIYVSPGAVLNLTNCILAGNYALGGNGKNGKNASSSGSNGSSGAAGTNGIGGAIYNRGTVNMTNSVIANNRAIGGDGGAGGLGGDGSVAGGAGGNGGKGALGWGGGIYNETNATLYIVNSVLTNNFAYGGFGGAGGLGGGAGFSGDLGDGGAGAEGLGGGIYNLGSVTLTNSLVMTNAAVGGDSAHAGTEGYGDAKAGKNGGVGYGGGIYNQGSLEAVNSTFTQNYAKGGVGGYCYSGDFVKAGNGGSGDGGAVFSGHIARISNCTLATNNATGGLKGLSNYPDNEKDGSNGSSLGGNIYRQSGGILTLHNTILAKGASGKNFDGSTTGVNAGYNLSSDATPSTFPTAAKNKDAKLLALANNGGPTDTMALSRGSPAIDAGDPGSCLPTDQRGVSRPQGSACDIGAYEWIPAFNVSGKIIDGTNRVDGVVISASGPVTNSAISLTNGTYSIPGLQVGNYTVTAGPSYSPSNQVVAVSGDVTNINFTFVGTKLSFPSYTPGTNAVFSFQVSGKPNQTYEVQRSADLVHWTNFLTQTNVTNGLLTIGMTNTSSVTQLFLRAIVK